MAESFATLAADGFHGRDDVLLRVVDTPPQRQRLAMAAAREHCAGGASRRAWAGDDATLETIAAVRSLHRHLLGRRVRMLNGLDPMADHVVHGPPDTTRVHAGGCDEGGTTTSPIAMVVRDGMSRYHRWREVARRVPDLGVAGQALVASCDDALARHERWVCELLEDMPEVRDWTWTAA